VYVLSIPKNKKFEYSLLVFKIFRYVRGVEINQAEVENIAEPFTP